jgi:hypothetical protein
MFRQVLRKVFFPWKQRRPVALLFLCSGQFAISFILSIHKQLRFCAKPFASPRVARFRHALWILPCIGAVVHLYSGSLFGN